MKYIKTYEKFDYKDPEYLIWLDIKEYIDYFFEKFESVAEIDFNRKVNTCELIYFSYDFTKEEITKIKQFYKSLEYVSFSKKRTTTEYDYELKLTINNENIIPLYNHIQILKDTNKYNL